MFNVGIYMIFESSYNIIDLRRKKKLK